MCWADASFLHRGRSLDRHQGLHELLVKAAAELGQGFGQDEMRLRTVRSNLGDGVVSGLHTIGSDETMQRLYEACVQDLAGFFASLPPSAPES